MRLATIADLNGDPSVIADLIDRASQLSQLYDDYIESDGGDGHTRASGIHASEIAGCERKIVYNLLNVEQRGAIRKNWRQRFEVGKYIHSMIQRDFHRMAETSGGRIHFQSEVPISPAFQEVARDLRIYSSCDGVFTFREEPLGPAYLRIGLEIKTEAPDGYEKLRAPKPEHIEQAHVYMRCLDLPLMFFMYINKGNQNNTSSIPPFLVTYNPEVWYQIEAKCRRLLQMANENTLPERQESIVCEFCPWSYTCEPNYGRRTSGSVSWKQVRRST